MPSKPYGMGRIWMKIQIEDAMQSASISHSKEGSMNVITGPGRVQVKCRDGHAILGATEIQTAFLIKFFSDLYIRD